MSSKIRCCSWLWTLSGEGEEGEKNREGRGERRERGERERERGGRVSILNTTQTVTLSLTFTYNPILRNERVTRQGVVLTYLLLLVIGSGEGIEGVPGRWV